MSHGNQARLQLLAFRGDIPGSSGDAGHDLGDARRPTIVANPPGDLRFRARIEAFLMTAAPRARDLEAALRVDYPAAVVRPRALAGERLEIWYVYRDGHWIRGEDDASG
jgi:hypothetical protein